LSCNQGYDDKNGSACEIHTCDATYHKGATPTDKNCEYDDECWSGADHYYKITKANAGYKDNAGTCKALQCSDYSDYPYDSEGTGYTCTATNDVPLGSKTGTCYSCTAKTCGSYSLKTKDEVADELKSTDYTCDKYTQYTGEGTSECYSCHQKSCKDYNTSYEGEIPTNNKCTETKPRDGLTCYTGCEAMECSTCTGTSVSESDCSASAGYTRTMSCTTCAGEDIYTCEVTNCSDYTLGSCPTNGSCSPCVTANDDGTTTKTYKFDGCKEGYKKDSEGKQCVNNCETDYTDDAGNCGTTGTAGWKLDEDQKQSTNGACMKCKEKSCADYSDYPYDSEGTGYTCKSQTKTLGNDTNGTCYSCEATGCSDYKETGDCTNITVKNGSCSICTTANDNGGTTTTHKITCDTGYATSTDDCGTAGSKGGWTFYGPPTCNPPGGAPGSGDSTSTYDDGSTCINCRLCTAKTCSSYSMVAADDAKRTSAGYTCDETATEQQTGDTTTECYSCTANDCESGYATESDGCGDGYTMDTTSINGYSGDEACYQCTENSSSGGSDGGSSSDTDPCSAEGAGLYSTYKNCPSDKPYLDMSRTKATLDDGTKCYECTNNTCTIEMCTGDLRSCESKCPSDKPVLDRSTPKGTAANGATCYACVDTDPCCAAPSGKLYAAQKYCPEGTTLDTSRSLYTINGTNCYECTGSSTSTSTRNCPTTTTSDTDPCSASYPGYASAAKYCDGTLDTTSGNFVAVGATKCYPCTSGCPTKDGIKYATDVKDCGKTGSTGWTLDTTQQVTGSDGETCSACVAKTCPRTSSSPWPSTCNKNADTCDTGLKFYSKDPMDSASKCASFGYEGSWVLDPDDNCTAGDTTYSYSCRPAYVCPKDYSVQSGPSTDHGRTPHTISNDVCANANAVDTDQPMTSTLLSSYTAYDYLNKYGYNYGVSRGNQTCYKCIVKTCTKDYFDYGPYADDTIKEYAKNFASYTECCADTGGINQTCYYNINGCKSCYYQDQYRCVKCASCSDGIHCDKKEQCEKQHWYNYTCN
jgi:hypothetical protein